MIEEMIKNFTIEEKKNLTFQDFTTLVQENPKKLLRNSAMYIKDMLDFYGKNPEGEFKIFLEDNPLHPPVYGQRNVQTVIYKSITNFIKEGQNNKFLLLTGPNGSAKSSMVTKLMYGCEKYSQEEEGSLYTFSWIFPVSSGSKLKGTTPLGLQKVKSSGAKESYAHSSEEDILTILPSELKDHPILLLPLEMRQDIIKKIYPKEDFAKIKRTYLYNGDLSHKNKVIFDSLLQSYEGDLEKVLRHVRVEKYNLSKRYSKSLCTIEPQMHVDAQVQQITMDRRISNLPPSIEHLNLVNMKGPLVSANRGILEYSDLLKRPLDTYKYLLMSIENKTININGLLTELDILFVGSSNEIHLEALRKHPDYNSFKGRFKFIHVPYLLDFKEEEKIYKNHVKRTSSKRFEPYALESLALFNVCLRLFKPQGKNYTGDKSNLISHLSSIDKAFIYSGKYNSLIHYDKEGLKYLKANERNIRKEYFNVHLYEGIFGISPREVKELIHEISNKKSFVSFLDVVSFLEDLTNHRLYKQYQENIKNKEHFQKYDDLDFVIREIKYFYLSKFKEEAQDSLNIIDNLNYDDFVKKYIDKLSAFHRGESVFNPLHNKKVKVTEKDLSFFEDKLNITSFEINDFRNNVLSNLLKLQENSLQEVYEESIYSRLRKEYNNKKIDALDKILGKINYYETKQVNKEMLEKIDKLIETLNKNFNYSKECSITLLKALNE